jgi:hypothetical protein
MDVVEERYPAIERALRLLKAKLRFSDSDIAAATTDEVLGLSTIAYPETVDVQLRCDPYLHEGCAIKDELKAKRSSILVLARERSLLTQSDRIKNRTRRLQFPKYAASVQTQTLKVTFLLWRSYIDEIIDVRIVCEQRIKM